MPIQKLSQDVINKIAAGEVVQRPANAIKELIENSIDAGGRNIKVKTKKGGLELFSIEDDGCGISKEDLPLAGVRFATSKLKDYEDLKDIGSFGFRGEALASISHVAHLTITSKPVDQQVSHRLTFDGGLANGEPTPCAGKNGTTILAKDLFHNMKTRKTSYSSSDEQFRIAEIIRAYAIHYSHLNFTLFKMDNSQTQVRSWNLKDRTSVVQSIYSKEIATHLLQTKIVDEEIGLEGISYFTGAGYAGKKTVLLLFINNRLIESKQVKQIVDSIYNDYLPKGARPWVYMSLTMPGKNIDVNVHPTKMEVQFLHDERIYDLIKRKFDMNLSPTNNDRTMTLVPTFLSNHETSLVDLNKTKAARVKSEYQHHTIRNDVDEQKIDSFLTKIEEIKSPRSSDKEKKQSPGKPEIYIDKRKSYKRKIEHNETINGTKKRQKLCLDSMTDLLVESERDTDGELKKLLEGSIYVGLVSKKTVIIQYDVNLLALNISQMSEELIYQVVLRDYGNFGIHLFKNPIDIQALMSICGIPPTKWKSCIDHLFDMKDMLSDYFSIKIDNDMNLCGMPTIIKGYRPDFRRIFVFINEIFKVQWTDEKVCLMGISKALAKMYSLENVDSTKIKELRPLVEHKFMSMFRSKLFQPRRGIIEQKPLTLTSLPQLYKVFERC